MITGHFSQVVCLATPFKNQRSLEWCLDSLVAPLFVGKRRHGFLEPCFRCFRRGFSGIVFGDTGLKAGARYQAGGTPSRLGWVTVDGGNPFRATQKPWKPEFVGIYRGIILPYFFLSGAKWNLSIHSNVAPDVGSNPPAEKLLAESDSLPSTKYLPCRPMLAQCWLLCQYQRKVLRSFPEPWAWGGLWFLRARQAANIFFPVLSFGFPKYTQVRILLPLSCSVAPFFPLFFGRLPH